MLSCVTPISHPAISDRATSGGSCCRTLLFFLQHVVLCYNQQCHVPIGPLQVGLAAEHFCFPFSSVSRLTPISHPAISDTTTGGSSCRTLLFSLQQCIPSYTNITPSNFRYDHRWVFMQNTSVFPSAVYPVLHQCHTQQFPIRPQVGLPAEHFCFPFSSLSHFTPISHPAVRYTHRARWVLLQNTSVFSSACSPVLHPAVR